ncbi:MAG: flagellar basal body-associated FliL family protein [Synergistaceae bacterium]|jgi:flagellar FliL protein|nr:flagellar basal body-associated FliL family protein [Synergistaceae bacterium]
MKRIIIFIIVGLVMFGVGFGGGFVFGRTRASGDAGGTGETRKVENPGPIVSVGEFTSNLAGSGRHVISFTVSLETLNAKAVELVSAPGWLLRIKNEILLLVKDKVYEDLTSAEGALQFSAEIKRALNAQLPDIRGEVPVSRVLFETFVLQ